MSMTKGYHNYRGRSRRQKRLLAVVLVLVILAALAFLVIQNYIVYDDQGHARVELPFAKKEPAPDPETPPVTGEDVNIDYIDNGYAPVLQSLQARLLPSAVLRQAPQETLAAFNEEAFAITVKRNNGAITYDTAMELPAEVEAERENSLENLQALLASDRYAVARMSVFCDSYFVRAYPDAALHWEGGDFWYDADAMAWLDPSHPQTLVYTTQLCQEYAALGFDEILLDYFSYPTTGELSAIGGLTDTDRVQVLTDFVKSLRANLPENVKLSIVLRSAVSEEFGLSADLLAKNFDRIYLEQGADADALRQSLPARFDFTSRLVPLVTEAPSEGSYLIQ